MYNMHTKLIKTIGVTEARKKIGQLLDAVVDRNQIIGLGRRRRPEALLIKYPTQLNPQWGEITNFNANSSSFDFLADELDLYSVSDLKKKYV